VVVSLFAFDGDNKAHYSGALELNGLRLLVFRRVSQSGKALYG
jgi:hypothetical protein